MQLIGGVQQVVAQSAERNLEEQPAPAGRSVGDQLQLMVAQRWHRERLQLATAVKRELDPLVRECVAELAHLLRQPGHVHELHVWRSDDALGAIVRGCPRVLDALVKRVRSVVHSRQDVAVQVDHATYPASAQSSA
jgi:hypothetical protein